MGDSVSKDRENREMHEDTKHTLQAMKWRLSRLEADNAMMSKTITNLKVSNNEMSRSLADLYKKVFGASVKEEERTLSIRVKKK